MSDRDEIYSYIKRKINPYGKPFKGTAFEFGVKIMDYIKNMTKEETPWISEADRLPEKPDTVLCRVRSTTISETETYILGIYHSGCWFYQRDTTGTYSYPLFDYEVLSWIPIPKENEKSEQIELAPEQKAASVIRTFIAQPDRMALTNQFMDCLRLAADRLEEITSNV